MNPTSDPLMHARQPLVDAMAQIFALYGWPEVAGRIYASLYMVSEPASQDAISQQLSISKATVSTHVRMLEALHLVRRVQVSVGDSSGGRPRIYYQAERDLMKAVRELVRHNARRETELAAQGLAETRRRLQALAGDESQPYLSQQVERELVLLQGFDTYLRWGNRLLWVVQRAERMQRFIHSLRPAESGEEVEEWQTEASV